MQTMLEGSGSEVVDTASVDDQQGIGRSGLGFPGEASVKFRQPALRGPAIIVVTQHDDVSIHKSTEDSRSETTVEDKDYYSETESTSFFITETEVDHHMLVAGEQRILIDANVTIRVSHLNG